MSENLQELMDGLRALAAAEPREASPKVEEILLARMRARAKRRRAELWGSVGAGIAAVAAATLLVFWIAPSETTPSPASKAAVTAPATDVDSQFAVLHTDEVTSSFYPLPVAESLPPLETGMVVRVQLTASSLRLMGVPMNDDQGGEPVEADVLLGQDGLARGVRLIQ